MEVRAAALGRSASLWLPARLVGLVLTLVLLAGLIQAPDLSLTILWNGVIPLLPAVFLIQPKIWRNVCPLATINVWGGHRWGRRTIWPDAARWLGALGIVLLFVMVPARRFLFNTDGAVLAATVVAVALLSLALGLVFDMKAGFCNALCPVLPVERLYGQRPMFQVSNARCAACSRCTRRGCIDLAPAKSVKQTLGKGADTFRWLLTPFGGFAAAFPGFVIGYYTTTDVPLSAAWSVYSHVGLWMLGSYAVVAALSLALRIPATLATVWIAGLAIGLYYWFAAPVVSEALVLPDTAPATMRVAAFALVAVWLWRATGGKQPANGGRR